mmetsp:Transcript_22197/g.43182  ORF Transcript_22197/g.43182 Transcript_22197/m.43182 type:complete len:476 (+) Transcript_22197:148-1575(+)|eukprot:CAMPEP_0173379346 /NCGR_PEP_ID=MMETSP1356-20130122/2333_1 /TAXON_ID=77927 ORGANISM="Hemiselmis virescens, Strain PCC157" /NCGR_SAMPLE_ID=MMETSP1356 /ASSEMBLY_ACC=CAM_ASM_000847 /LENGTH=475 /DNA_ID=CAMNT_0014332671 /DNA_START=130 /DNA_END=1557 /DNA_ORIENTATION=+
MSGEEKEAGIPDDDIPLPEGRYKLTGIYSSPSNRHVVNHRVTKPSYIRAQAQAVRQVSATIASPASKSMSMFNITKKFSSPAAPTPLPPPVVTGESADYFVFLSGGDSLCVCSLSVPDDTDAVREKRFQASEPTCCSVNPYTSAVDNLDTVVGFESGEILLVDALTSNQTGKFNSGSAQNMSRVTDVQWIPDSHNLFIAGFGNGVLLVYDRDKEDTQRNSSSSASQTIDPAGGGDAGFVVHHPRTSKSNPVARWLVSKGPINHVCFSGDGNMAVSCHDGYVRVFDFANEKLLYSLKSHYGAMLCSAWSPDNKFLVTGGEDDLVIAWSWVEKAPLACCVGHNSWISAIAFDPELCDATHGATGGGNYRFHSVGQDGRICTWDLNDTNLVFSRKRAGDKSRRTSFATPPSAKGGLRNVAEVPRADEMASLTPTANTLIDSEPLSSVHVTPQGIVTSCFSGEVKLWERPPRSRSDDGD